MSLDFSHVLFRYGLAIILAISSTVASGNTTAIPTVAPAQEHISSSDLVGKWVLDRSTAVFEITDHGGVIEISGEDSEDGEKFIVTNVTWDGQVLKADFLMPSTKWRTHAELLQIAPDLLYGKYADGTPEVWRKLK